MTKYGKFPSVCFNAVASTIFHENQITCMVDVSFGSFFLWHNIIVLERQIYSSPNQLEFLVIVHLET